MKMNDEALLSHLKAMESDSAQFVTGQLATERERAMKAYYRHPYGNEEEGWSSIVTSEVQDTVEWILPSLLKIFTSTDKAVSFEPQREADVKGADQATDACNYVFYRQNNGFLTLYTAIKDALISKNCAVMWRKETKRVKSVTPATGATAEMLAMLLQEAGEDGEIESATPQPPQPMQGPGGQPAMDMFGQPLMSPQTYNARISRIKARTTVKVEAFAPETLIIKRDWTSPLLDDCPYVCRVMLVTLSDLKEMGFDDVKPEDLTTSTEQDSADANYRLNRAGTDGPFVGTDNPNLAQDDDSRTEGHLLIEYVLVDYDGDGISERRCIYRLADKILSNDECAQVPIATSSPILVPHRWDGMGMEDAIGDLQQLKTELTRQMLNSAYLANSPRTEVLTDPNGSPYANIDDLLDSRPGGIIRKQRPDALVQNVVPFVGGQMLPLLAYVDEMGERRTGVSRQSTGLDPNALRGDRTLGDAQMMNNAVQARTELVARILAETLLKPIFKGILKELTSGDMEKIAFRLRDEFIELDPNEWRDSYDMTINVGLGTGDRNQQLGHLSAIGQAQMALAQSPFGQLLITPQNIYNTQAKVVESAGFKNVADFWTDPKGRQVPPLPPPQDPSIQIKQMELQADAQKFQAESQQKRQQAQEERSLQAQVDQNRQEWEARQKTMEQQNQAQLALQAAQIKDAQHQREIDFKRWQAELEASVRIETANIGSKAKIDNAATQTATNEIASEVSQ